MHWDLQVRTFLFLFLLLPISLNYLLPSLSFFPFHPSIFFCSLLFFSLSIPLFSFIIHPQFSIPLVSSLLIFNSTIIYPTAFCVSSDPTIASLALTTGVLSSGCLGLHMTSSIGGADMPVVVTLLNSYSGWVRLC